VCTHPLAIPSSETAIKSANAFFFISGYATISVPTVKLFQLFHLTSDLRVRRLPSTLPPDRIAQRSMDRLQPQLRRTGAWLFAWVALTSALVQGVIGEAAFSGHIFTNVAGQTLPYRLLQPESSSGSYPLVLFFHGAGERGVDNQKQLIHGTSLYLQPENRLAYPCFVLTPQCPEGQQWVDMPWGAESGERPPQPSVAMNLALQILNRVIHDYPVDTNRIYVTGLSMGGFAAWDCITRFPQRFAAAVPICGGGDEKTVTPEVAQVPVWAFHSDDDTTVKVWRTRRMIEAMRQAGGQPKYMEYTGLGHNSWDKAYGEPDLLPWIFSQRRDNMSQPKPANPPHQTERAPK
jgi:predicted peptidase